MFFLQTVEAVFATQSKEDLLQEGEWEKNGGKRYWINQKFSAAGPHTRSA